MSVRNSSARGRAQGSIRVAWDRHARHLHEAVEVAPAVDQQRADVIGACAKYRTVTTSTPPANLTQGFANAMVSSRCLLPSRRLSGNR